MAYKSVPLESKENNASERNKEEMEESDVGSVREDTEEALKKKLMFKEKDISLVKLLFHLCQGHDYFIMVIGLIGALGSGVAMPMIAYLSGDMFSQVGGDAEQNTGSMTYEDTLKLFDAIDDALMTQVYRFLYIGIGMFFANLFNAGGWTYVGLRATYTLKKRYFTKIFEQEQGWFDANNAFEFATKVQAQLEQVEIGISDKIGVIIQQFAQVIAGLCIAFTSSWKLTLVMLCVAPFIVIDMLILITALKTGIVLGRRTYEKAGGMAEEVLYNIKTVSSFSNFEFETKRFNKVIDKVHALNKGVMIKLGGCMGALIFFMNLSFSISFIYARHLILNHEYNSSTGREFKGGDVFTVIMSTVMSIMSLGMIGPTLKMVQESCTATSDYFTLVERKVEIDTSESTYRPKKDDVKGKIEFKNVEFFYPSDEDRRKILHGINLTFEAGKKVALVGESGCGKSTTVNLIERLYEPTGGEVLIDGINIKKYDLPYLRTLIGYVQQEPVLFNRSIEDNLMFGREDVIEDQKLGDPRELMQNACDEAFASEFIRKLPDKYQYVVGVKGNKLSGGQKQRLAIARAILTKPKILILDEATSALDNKSEKEVQRALDNISGKNVTTVIIAHRLSTIKNADLIYAIKEGKVIESGTHEELVAKKGYYEGLVRSQMGQEELEKKEENLEK